MTKNKEPPAGQEQNEDEERANTAARACPECGSASIVHDQSRAEVVCSRCGLVLEERIADHGPEWRAFDSEQRDKRSRTGAPMTYLLHDKGLSTDIGWRNKDSYGKTIPPRARAQLYRLRKWHRRARMGSAAERNLAFALSEMDRMASHIGLPRNVREMAAVTYRRAVGADLVRGRTIEGVAAASVYAACRIAGVPRTLDEIADASRVSRKELGRTYRLLSRKLKLRLPPTSPLDYLPRFCSKLSTSAHVQARSVDIIKRAMREGLTNGKGPKSTAAAALYLASLLEGERRSQREIAEASDVTEVTIRNRYKEFVSELDLGDELDAAVATGRADDAGHAEA